MITWAERQREIRERLGREPTLEEWIDLACQHTITPEEKQAQRESWVRAFAPCEHGVADFETCPDCQACGSRKAEI